MGKKKILKKVPNRAKSSIAFAFPSTHSIILVFRKITHTLLTQAYCQLRYQI